MQPVVATATEDPDSGFRSLLAAMAVYWPVDSQTLRFWKLSIPNPSNSVFQTLTMIIRRVI